MLIKHTVELKQPISLFFFAHQDDEFAVFQRISMECQLGHRVICAYLTSGVQAGESVLTRNEESLKVLENLGVNREDVFFAGHEHNIADGQLIVHFDRAIYWITDWIHCFDLINQIFIPSWEGGHPDHDLLHAAVLIATLDSKLTILLRQFSLYNAYKCPTPFFRVLSPLDKNGPVTDTAIPWKNRIRFLKYCLSYPSQSKSWLGLFPVTALHYIFSGVESVQNVSLRRLSERPHEGQLYYERRRFCKWSEVKFAINEYLKRKSITLS